MHLNGCEGPIKLSEHTTVICVSLNITLATRMQLLFAPFSKPALPSPLCVGTDTLQTLLSSHRVLGEHRGTPGCYSPTAMWELWIVISTHTTSDLHDDRLATVLDVLARHNLTLNGEKCVFATPVIEFVGFCLTADTLWRLRQGHSPQLSMRAVAYVPVWMTFHTPNRSPGPHSSSGHNWIRGQAASFVRRKITDLKLQYRC